MDHVRSKHTPDHIVAPVADRHAQSPLDNEKIDLRIAGHVLRLTGIK